MVDRAADSGRQHRLRLLAMLLLESLVVLPAILVLLHAIFGMFKSGKQFEGEKFYKMA